MTDAAGVDLMKIIKLVCGGTVDVPTFGQIKEAVKRCDFVTSQRIEMCPNDCIVYYDSKNLPEEHACKHAHRTFCVECGAQRYVTDPKDGRQIPAKVIYFFPVAPYLRGVFSKPELVNHLLLNVGDRPEVTLQPDSA